MKRNTQEAPPPLLSNCGQNSGEGRSLDHEIVQRKQRIVALQQEIALLKAANSISVGNSPSDHKIMPSNMSSSNINTPLGYLEEEEEEKVPSDDDEGNRESHDNIAQALFAAVAVANEPCATNVGVGDAFFCEDKAFQHFFLVSADLSNKYTSVSKGLLEQRGTRYIDPFWLQSSKVLDAFPSMDTPVPLAGDPALNADAYAGHYKTHLPSFCLPHGVGVRLVPRVALNRAKTMGWLGSSADNYHVLVLTDSKGKASHGVAITVREELYNPKLLKLVKRQRACRRAALVITRWWQYRRKHRFVVSSSRQIYRRPLRPSLASYHSRNGADSCCADDMTLSSEKSDATNRSSMTRMSTRNLFRSWNSRDWGGRAEDLDWWNNVCRGSSDRFLGHANHSHDKTNGSNSNSMSSRSSGSGSSCSSSTTASSRGVSVFSHFTRAAMSPEKRRERNNAKASHQQMGVREVLQHFLKTSPIPLYNKAKNEGVWRSAKVRFKSGVREYEVVLAHYPLRVSRSNGQIKKPYNYSKYYQKERMRLMKMLKDVTSPPPGKDHISQPCKVACITFHELGTDNEVVATNTVTLKGVSPKEQQAEEAYQEMMSSEKLGEVLVVEKCYVFVGCEPSKLCLLFAALQQVVNIDREPDHGRAGWSNDGMPELERPNRKFLKNASFSRLTPFSTIIQPSVTRSNRHAVLAEIRQRAAISSFDEDVGLLAEDQGLEGRRTFTLSLPFQGSTTIEMPLPLPKVAEQWGLGTLLLRLGSDNLLKLLRIILLERSVLVLGDSAETVTSGACALLDLLRPYVWAGVFLPLLPTKMMDLVNAPVPFIVGMAVDGARELRQIETDTKVMDAVREGMVLVNLVKGTLTVQSDDVMAPRGLSRTMHVLENNLRSQVNQPSFLYCSLISFVNKGLAIDEIKILHQARNAVFEYMTDLAGDLATDKSAWKKYGAYDDKTDRFDFWPSTFYSPLFAELQFRKRMAHTQLFSSFVHSKRNEDLEEISYHRGTTSDVLENFVFDKWNAQCA